MRVQDQKGFTLVELTVVMLVLVLLASASISVGDLSGNRAAVLGRKLVGDIRYAQQLANALRVRHGVEVTSASAYRVFRDDGGAGTTVTHPMTGSPYIVNTAGDFAGVSLSTTLGGAPPKAKFDSLGRPFDGNDTAIAAGVNTITVLASGAAVGFVAVEPNTGLLTMN